MELGDSSKTLHMIPSTTERNKFKRLNPCLATSLKRQVTDRIILYVPVDVSHYYSNFTESEGTMKEMQRRHPQKQQQQRTSEPSSSANNASRSVNNSDTGKMSDKLKTAEQQQQQQQQRTSSFKSDANIPLLIKECILLLQTRQYASCELLTGYLLSSLEADSTQPSWTHHYATALELFGDCLSQMNPPQLRRAVSYYRRATTSWQHNDDDDNNNVVSLVVNVQLKTFKCLMALTSYKEAYGILNTLLVNPGALPQELRTFELSMEFATLCTTIDLEKDARHWYLDALRLNPYALEAIEMLAALGIDMGLVQVAVQTGLEHKKKQQQQQQQQYGDHPLIPIQDIVVAQFQAACNQNPTALSKYRALAERFPNNVHLLSKIALLEFHLGEYTKSEQTFTQIRQLDSQCMDHMDEYAELLRRKRAASKLNQLSTDLLQINDSRPEAWVCLALYHQSKASSTGGSNSSTMMNGEQSMSFIERALRLNPNYAYAHYIRGMLLLLEHMPDEAITSFHCANKLKKNVTHYEGLVEAYLMEEKYKEAVTMAKEAMVIAPKDPRTFTLIGLALSHSPSTNRDGKEKAKKAFRKALYIDPSALRPMFALADIFQREKDFSPGIDLLLRAIEQPGQRKEELDMVHTKLADLYTAAENYNDAFTHYHVAVSMNHGNMVARRGLDRLEKLMRGLDPDASAGANDNNSDEYDDDEIDNSTTGNFEVDAGEMGYL